MPSTHSIAAAIENRPHFDRLHAAFTNAAKPHMTSLISELPMPRIGQRVWGFAVGSALAVVYAMESLMGTGQRPGTEPKRSFEENMSAEYAQALTSTWLRGLRRSTEHGGNIQDGAVLPGDPAFAGHWKEALKSLEQYGDIDAGAVLHAGLLELAQNPGDLTLPHGMIIKRPVLDAALARGPRA